MKKNENSVIVTIDGSICNVSYCIEQDSRGRIRFEIGNDYEIDVESYVNPEFISFAYTTDEGDIIIATSNNIPSLIALICAYVIDKDLDIKNIENTVNS